MTEHDGETSDRPDPHLVADNTGLTAHNLGKRFKKRPVLRNVSLTLQRGEAVGLLGPNGAGKTTCFYIITGLSFIRSSNRKAKINVRLMRYFYQCYFHVKPLPLSPLQA